MQVLFFCCMIKLSTKRFIILRSTARHWDDQKRFIMAQLRKAENHADVKTVIKISKHQHCRIFSMVLAFLGFNRFPVKTT